MKKVRITVMEKTFNEKYVQEYGVENIGPCPLLEEGQTFLTTFEKPADFCEEAWSALQKYVFALSAGADNFFDHRWTKDDRKLIVCCNDGLRPVIFKLEVLKA